MPIKPLKTNFDKKYWDTTYKEPEIMDGIANAKIHANYLQMLFGLQSIEINSVIDLGFGYGNIFKETLNTFPIERSCAIEPSEYIFKEFAKDNFIPDHPSTILNQSIMDWCKKPPKDFINFDLAICTSVFQYIKSKDLAIIIPILSKRIKYLYLTVPTHHELQRQVSELDFFDPYAIRRPKQFYTSLLTKHFTFISFRLLESKTYFNVKNSNFSDLLYRF
ncbi:MAG: class I SAM-dependent methyltransferase [Bacteriovoracaceae bacterium]